MTENDINYIEGLVDCLGLKSARPDPDNGVLLSATFVTALRPVHLSMLLGVDGDVKRLIAEVRRLRALVGARADSDKSDNPDK